MINENLEDFLGVDEFDLNSNAENDKTPVWSLIILFTLESVGPN